MRTSSNRTSTVCEHKYCIISTSNHAVSQTEMYAFESESNWTEIGYSMRAIFIFNLHIVRIQCDTKTHFFRLNTSKQRISKCFPSGSFSHLIYCVVSLNSIRNVLLMFSLNLNALLIFFFIWSQGAIYTQESAHTCLFAIRSNARGSVCVCWSDF